MSVTRWARRLCWVLAPVGLINAGGVARADSGAQVGILECTIVPGSGYTILIHSSSKAKCVFRTPEGSERYSATMGVGIGLDLRWTRTREISFTVVSVGGRAKPGGHALAGKYFGASAAVAIGLGLGAQVLVGGGENGFALQPLGIETSEGVGVAAGLGYLFLDPA
jgi:hypothetical protein